MVPGVLSTMDGENQEPTSSSPVIAVLRANIFRLDSKVLIALAVASRGVGENAAWRLQVVVRREVTRLVPGGQVSSRLPTSLCSALGHLLKGRHTATSGPLNPGCGSIFARSLLTASDHASRLGMLFLVLQL